MSLSSLLHSVWQSLGPSMSLQMALFCSFFYGWLIFHCIYVPLLISVLTSRNIINLSFKRKTVWNKKLFHNIILLLIPLGFYSYALDSIHIASTICRSFSNKYTRSFHFWIKWALIIEIYIFQSQKNIKSEKYGGRGGKKVQEWERKKRKRQASNKFAQ